MGYTINIYHDTPYIINIWLNRLSPCEYLHHSTFSSSKFVWKSPCSQLKLNPWLCSCYTIVEASNDTIYFFDIHISNKRQFLLPLLVIGPRNRYCLDLNQLQLRILSIFSEFYDRNNIVFIIYKWNIQLIYIMIHRL